MAYILINKQRYEVEVSTFAGGEEKVVVPSYVYEEDTPVVVNIKLRSSSDVMRLAMIKDALDRENPHKTETWLNIGYVPYARQDRVCNAGEALSIKVFCNLINSLGFDKVYVTDPHSDVATALLDNVEVKDQRSCFLDTRYRFKEYQHATVVAPDAGAEKKATRIAKFFGKGELLTATKVRDLNTGDILETKVLGDVVAGEYYLIVDDICDGGRTFIELAKVLKAKGAGKVGLYVTHGIFSKGKKVFDGLIDDVYSYDDWTQDQ